VRAVTLVSAAPPVRRLVPALVAALALCLLATGRTADGAPHAWSVYLAPTGACQAADDASAPADVQARAVACLVNWARTHDGRSRLAPRPALRKAAQSKGLRVASCGDFSHTPCGSPITAAVNASGYRYGWFGENLFAGLYGRVSARQVVTAWLQSPTHRANMLQPNFRHVGVAPVRAPGLLDGTDAVVWTAAFASPR
jgi:uncharacterized protein YkwD